jgi:hypothetical protein
MLVGLVLLSGFGCLIWIGNIPFIQNEKRISIFFKCCFLVREAKMWVFEGDLGAYGTASGAFKSGISRIRGVYINFSQDPKTYICLMSVVELVIAPDF